MADGPYRFQQPGAGQYYYPQHNQQNHHGRHLPRNQSPGNSGRAGYSNDTPSPSRSPVSQSAAHIPFGMYNQGHQQGQHMMMNGGPSHQRYNMHMNLAQKYQHQTHQQHHGQQHHQQQQTQGGHGGHGNNIAHQHTFSSGALSSTTPHFTPSHLQNGSSNNALGNLTEPISEHWQQQLQLVQESRQASSPHYYARTLAQTNKAVSQSTSSAQTDGDKEERNRPTTNNESRRQQWMALDFGGQGLRSISDALFNYQFLDKLYFNHNKLVHLPAAIGRLRNLTHLDLSNNQLSELPPEIGMLVNLKTLYLFDNNLHSLPCEMGFLCHLETLGIEGNPLEEESKSEVMQNGTKALIIRLRENLPVHPPPSQRDWVVLDDTPAPSSGPPPEKFSVLTYNILCDRAATQTQYGYTPSQALSWDYRKDLILQEIRELNADIVCLQEVDMDSFNEYFRAQLAYNDYKGVFWPKPRARTMPEKEAKQVDGCATFFKGSKYVLLDKQIIDLANTAINRPDMKGEHDIFNRVMPRDNIAVVTFFENRVTGSRYIILNTHIYWDPAYRDVKLVQVAIMMEQLTKLADRYARFPACTDKVALRISDHDNGDSNSTSPVEPPAEPGPSLEYSTGSQIPLIVCGDFNSTAGSGVHDLLAHGTLAHTHADFGKHKYGNFTRDGMAHPFSLKSSYGNIGELTFTNYTPGFTDVVDYIWYSTNSLQVTGLLGEVDKEYLQRVPGFPNYHFPSDHLALLAEFLVKKQKERKVVEADFGPQRERDGR